MAVEHVSAVGLVSARRPFYCHDCGADSPRDCSHTAAGARAHVQKRRRALGAKARFVAIVRPGPHGHRAAVYYVEAGTRAWARRWLLKCAIPKPRYIRLREVTDMGTKYTTDGMGTTRIPPLVRLWSVE